MTDNKQQYSKLKKLLSSEIIELVKEDLSYIINTDDFKKAFELIGIIQPNLDRNRQGEKEYQDIFHFYKKVIVKCKFIALHLLENKEVVNLFRDNFTKQFSIDNYDLLRKFKSKMVTISDVQERDKLKQETKKALLINKEIITNKASIKSIDEWLRDYNSKLGIDIADNLKRIQYLVALKSRKDIRSEYYKNLKILFDFYEILKLSSASPYGFEDDVPIMVKDKLYIFKQGKLEPIDGGSGKNQPKSKNLQDVEELKILLDKYSDGSLERKAIQEEIERIEKRM